MLYGDIFTRSFLLLLHVRENIRHSLAEKLRLFRSAAAAAGLVLALCETVRDLLDKLVLILCAGMCVRVVCERRFVLVR